jgi:hypothetical protein
MNQFSKKGKEYDLEERTARFAEMVIDLVKIIKINDIIV